MGKINFFSRKIFAEFTMVALCVLVGVTFTMGRELTMTGLQLWNAEYWQTINVGDVCGPNYEFKNLKPLTIVGVRNGWHSGFVVVSCSTAPIESLKATITDFTGEGGKKITADKVLIRYAEAAQQNSSWAPPHRFDRLLSEPPDAIEMLTPKAFRVWKPKNAGPVAMLPIWVSVGVPVDAAPGEYEATLKIEADETEPYTLPVKLTVYDWLLSSPLEYSVKNMGWMCYERQALYYNVPMWSDRHFELIGKALDMMLYIGCRHVEVNMVLRYPARDNTEVMVTWIKQPDGTYKYDFTVFDKFMATVNKVMGKPLVIRLNMWSAAPRDPPHKVSVFDPATGEKSELVPPAHGTPESLAFWKPVMTELREHTDKLGWSDVVAPNWHEYCGGPDSNTVHNLLQIWPDAKWADTDHGRRTGFRGLSKEEWVPVLVQSTVWNEGPIKLRGYKGKNFDAPYYCGHARNRTSENSPLWDVRVFIEETIGKGEHGVDPIGGDLWMLEDDRGHWRGGQWAAAAQGPGNSTRAFLAPGPKGAIATERYEAMRESVQICEMIIYIQRALESGKLDAKLAERVNTILDERSNVLMDSWVVADKSGRKAFSEEVAAKGAFERDKALFELAADVARALK